MNKTDAIYKYRVESMLLYTCSLGINVFKEDLLRIARLSTLSWKKTGK